MAALVVSVLLAVEFGGGGGVMLLVVMAVQT